MNIKKRLSNWLIQFLQLNAIRIDPNELIHGAKNGNLGSSGAQSPAYERFFVGSENDYQKSDHNFTY
jgi:hypothetical protein